MSTIAAIRSVIYDICLPVTITYETESFQINKAWIGGAFLLGILFGILATAFCAPIFIRDYFKKQVSKIKEFNKAFIIIDYCYAISLLLIYNSFFFSQFMNFSLRIKDFIRF